MVKNLPAVQETQVQSLIRKSPWRRERLRTPVFLGFPDGSDAKEPTIIQEAQVQSLGQEDALKKALATHSGILDCRIPRTEEPGDYSPWGRKESDTTEQLFSAYTNCGGPMSPHHSKVCGLVSSQDLQLQGFKEIKLFYLMSR